MLHPHSYAGCSEQAQFYLAHKTRTIATHGEAEVKVRPDRVTFVLRSERRETTLPPALAHVEGVFRKIFETARKYGVPECRMQTDNLVIRPEIEYESGVLRQKKVSKFFVTKAVSVTLEGDQLASYSDIMKDFMLSGCTAEGEERFETSKLFEHRTRARHMATQNAIAKAQALIEGLPLVLGAPIYVHEGATGTSGGGRRRYAPQMQMQQMQMNVSLPMAAEEGDGLSAEGSTFSTGSIAVTATVDVCFELLERPLPPGGLVATALPPPSPAAPPAGPAGSAAAAPGPAPAPAR